MPILAIKRARENYFELQKRNDQFSQNEHPLKRKRARIDTTKAIVDFLIYLSFALIVYAPIHIVTYVLLGLPLRALIGLIIPLVAYLLYMMSWDGLRTYYNYVTAVFDSYREELKKRLTIKDKKEVEKEKEEWAKRWRYLQYHEYP